MSHHLLTSCIAFLDYLEEMLLENAKLLDENFRFSDCLLFFFYIQGSPTLLAVTL